MTGSQQGTGDLSGTCCSVPLDSGPVKHLSACAEQAFTNVDGGAPTRRRVLRPALDQSFSFSCSAPAGVLSSYLASGIASSSFEARTLW